ncbi:MAG: hypothetical protein V4658_13930 [Bacteroidota bacterium]
MFDEVYDKAFDSVIGYCVHRTLIEGELLSNVDRLKSNFPLNPTYSEVNITTHKISFGNDNVKFEGTISRDILDLCLHELTDKVKIFQRYRLLGFN